MMGRVLCLVCAAIATGTACAPADAIDVSGRWHEDWSCDESCGGAAAQTVTGGVDMTLTQDGSAVTREDDDGTVWQGSLDGLVLTLSTDAGDYREDSTFTFDAGATEFTVRSSYTAAGDCSGDCTGSGRRLD